MTVLILKGLKIIRYVSILKQTVYKRTSCFDTHRAIFRPTSCRSKHTKVYCIAGSPTLHSFISIQPYRPGWQEPEPSHVTGMALAHCILGKFLRTVYHCFPSSLDVPTFAARCLYVRSDARDPSSERWNCGREIFPVILPKFRLPLKFRDLLHATNLRHGTDCFTSPPKEVVLRIFSP